MRSWKPIAERHVETGSEGPEPAREIAFRRERLVPPALLSALVLAAAPFLGRLRDLALERFSDRAVIAGTVAFATVIAAALLLAVLRIRRRRAWRYAGLGLCLALVWIQLAGFSTGIPEVDVVERAHLLGYGLLAALLYRAFRPLGLAQALLLPVLGGVQVGILDEWLQWLVASRVGEVGDVWLNSAATATGLLFAVVVGPPRSPSLELGGSSRRSIAGAAALTVLTFGGFYHCAHLGHLVRDPDEGLVFRSWFAPDELPAVAAERQRRWRSGRLPSLESLRREDYYFLEGTAHVAHRNASLQRGAFAAAWGEQRLLERYYAPVLEQRGLHSGAPLGLGRDDRDALHRRAEGAGRMGYSSPVLAERIATRPTRTTWWAGVGTLAAVLVVLGFGRRPRARTEPARVTRAGGRG